jgi:sarcosine oxidase, subunit beta
MQHYDIAIIGAGIVGCSSAFALAKRGLRTLNIDSLPAAGYGSTSASSAIIRPMYSHTVSACVAHESRHHWLNWPAYVDIGRDEPLAEYRECGGLMLLKEGELASTSDMQAAMSEAGVHFEVIESAQIEALHPGISLAGYGPPRPMDDPAFGLPTSGAISHGILVHECGYVSDPQLAARNLYNAAQKLGAEFLFNHQVRDIQSTQAGFRIITDQAEITADRVLNAAGPHSAAVNSLAGVELPIDTRPLRHEVTYLNAEVQHFDKGATVIVDTDAGVYQRSDGADMLIGTTDPDCDEEDLVDPDQVNMNLTGKWTRQAMRAAQRFPQYRIPNQARGTVGVYDVSTDWIPIYDCTDLPNYFVAIGTSGNQFKNAPLIGEIMAEIVCAPDHNRLSATLILEHVKQTIDLSFYSRNRVVQETRGVMA